jgi:hypothetical protein
MQGEGVQGAGSAKELSTFYGRIRAAMARHGWPTTRDGRDIAVVVLRSKWIEHYKKQPKVSTPSRPTFYDWLEHKDPKISIRNLFLLSDLLDVNARWLAMNEGSMAKPLMPDMDAQPLFDAWNHLNAAAREELIKEANKLLRVQGVPSAANPFSNQQKTPSSTKR